MDIIWIYPKVSKMETRTLDITEFPALGSRRAQRLSEQLQAIFEAYVNLPENLKKNALVWLYTNGQVSLSLFGSYPAYGKATLKEFSRDDVEHMAAAPDLSWSAFVAELKQALDIIHWDLMRGEQAIELVKVWKSQNEPGYEE